MSDQQKSDEIMTEESQVASGEVEPQAESISAVAVAMPGALLAQRRQERGLDVESVSRSLKLAQRQILAIETDDYAALPGMVITRGFIRSYAKLVGMDAAPLLDMLPKGDAEPKAAAPRMMSEPFQESTLPLRGNGQRKKLGKWLAVAVVVAIVLGYGLNRNGWIDHVPGASAVEDAAEAVAGDDTAQPEIVPPAVEVTVANDVPLAPAQVQAPAQVPAVEARAAANDKASVAPVTPILRVSQSKDLLRLQFEEDSWVEIRRETDNEIVFARLLLAGTTESFDINEPVSLVIGNASKVTATLRGKELVLPASKNDVSRVNVK